MDNYEKRVRAYERQGLTRSDAQGVVDVEDIKERIRDAAPDLLEALEACQFAIKLGLNAELKPYAKAWNGLLHSVDAAIAKAKP